jgi:hypothetical protein
MLDPIIHFLGSILATAYALIPNLGLAIILLTVIANLAVLPLTLKQVRSMAALQEIQPLLKDLQKEHKGDRSKLNEETVALYKEKGVNPASGFNLSAPRTSCAGSGSQRWRNLTLAISCHTTCDTRLPVWRSQPVQA